VNIWGTTPSTKKLTQITCSSFRNFFKCPQIAVAAEIHTYFKVFLKVLFLNAGTGTQNPTTPLCAQVYLVCPDERQHLPAQQIVFLLLQTATRSCTEITLELQLAKIASN